MSLRAVGSLLARRFAPRGISRAQAQSSPVFRIEKKAPAGSVAGRPSRFLHKLRRLSAGNRAYGVAAATAALASGFVALLYIEEGTEKSDVLVTDEVTSVEARQEVPDHKEATKEVTGKEGGIDNVTGNDEADEELEDLKVDEETMRARFEDWMKEYGRSYESEEEKARRYEIYKNNAMNADKLTASDPSGARFGDPAFSDWTEDGARFGDTAFSDWTEEEYMGMCGGRSWDDD